MLDGRSPELVALPARVSTGLERGVRIIHVAEQIELRQLLAAMNRVANEYSDSRRLWSLSGCFAFNTDEIASIAHQGRKLWPTAARVACLAEDDLSFGCLRMLEVYREDENYFLRAFRDRQTALEWLGRPL